MRSALECYKLVPRHSGPDYYYAPYGEGAKETRFPRQLWEGWCLDQKV